MRYNELISKKEGKAKTKIFLVSQNIIMDAIKMTDRTLNNVVIHALVKEQHQAIRPSIVRDTVLDNENDAVIKTVWSIVDVYGTRNNSAHYGIFKTGEGRGDFPDSFESYTEHQSPTEQQFLELTGVAMERLYDKASATPASSGGYMLFADYSNAQGRYFLIAMIKQKPGIMLTENLELEELMELDLSKLNQAARISFGKLSAYMAAEEDDRQELSYLSFVSPSSAKTASGYFVTALGCSEGAAAAQATKTLIREGRKFFKEKEGLRANREAFNNALMEYLKNKEEHGESVKLSEVEHIAIAHIPNELADQAEGIVSELTARLNSEECGVPAVFPVSSAALKRFTHISGESNSWKMTFDRTALGMDEAAEVFYDKDAGKITLRNIPERMRQSIEDELSNRSEG